MRYNMNTGVEFNLQKMGLKAHRNGFYSTESEYSENPILYIGNDGEFVIMNRGGAVRLTIKDAEAIARELPDVIRDYKDFKREGRRFA